MVTLTGTNNARSRNQRWYPKTCGSPPALNSGRATNAGYVWLLSYLYIHHEEGHCLDLQLDGSRRQAEPWFLARIPMRVSTRDRERVILPPLFTHIKIVA